MIQIQVGWLTDACGISRQTLPPDAMRRFIHRVGGRGCSFALVDT